MRVEAGHDAGSHEHRTGDEPSSPVLTLHPSPSTGRGSGEWRREGTTTDWAKGLQSLGPRHEALPSGFAFQQATIADRSKPPAAVASGGFLYSRACPV
nr:MAG TPA: hypothetical protein [Caudoviricetes sp.]